MSTAGKVLVVLIMLTAIGCLILAGGVAQLNTNANQKLQQLTADLEKTQAAIETTRQDIKSHRDQTTIAQEKIDREITALRSQQTDLERSRSQISDTLSRLQYDLGTVNATIAAARESLQNRVTEFDNEQTAMAELRRHVQSLQAHNSELMGRLKSLRDQFRDTHHKNLEMLGKPR
jgi:chromosome segregation ATPase